MIAFLIFRELRQPVLSIGFRDIGVLRAAMPEATIDEDRYPRSWEHDVDGNALDASMQTETQPFGMPRRRDCPDYSRH